MYLSTICGPNHMDMHTPAAMYGPMASLLSAPASFILAIWMTAASRNDMKNATIVLLAPSALADGFNIGQAGGGE